MDQYGHDVMSTALSMSMSKLVNDPHAQASVMQMQLQLQRINIPARKAESEQIRSNPAWSEAGQGEVTY